MEETETNNPTQKTEDFRSQSATKIEQASFQSTTNEQVSLRSTTSADPKKEEAAIVLDYLPYGYPLEKKMMPMVQAIGKKNFTLLQIVPRRGMVFELKEEVYIGDGKRDKVLYILGRLPREKLTETAKGQLNEFIEKSVNEDEKRFVEFFNTAQAMNTRLHQFELLPGFGKKHTKALLDERKERPFESFDDIKSRVSGVPDPKKAIEKRIVEELTEIQRNNLFIK